MDTQVQYRIGEYAGKVWQYLKENGECTTAQLEKGVEISEEIPMPKNLLYMAIGWLAREGNLAFKEDGEGKRYRLYISLK